MCFIPFAEVRDFDRYVYEVVSMAEDWQDSVSGLGFFAASEPDCRRALEGLSTVRDQAVGGSAETEMAEIWRAVERKCMYWAAVTIMDARIGEVGHAGGSGKSMEISSESSEAGHAGGSGKAQKISSESSEVPVSPEV